MIRADKVLQGKNSKPLQARRLSDMCPRIYFLTTQKRRGANRGPELTEKAAKAANSLGVGRDLLEQLQLRVPG